MSINEPRQTKAEKQAAARAAREQKTASDASAAQKRRRLWQLGGVAAVAAAIIVAIVIATSGGGPSKGGKPAGQPNGIADVSASLKGVPQKGLVAGKANAPYTFVEFGDLKCPVCRQFDVNSLPTILKNYVQTGKVKFEMRLMHFLDNNTPGTADSENAARYAEASGLQGRGISFVELWYFNQQDESSVYASPEYLDWIGSAVGVDTAKATKDAKLKIWAPIFKKNETEFAANGFTGTPSFLFGKTGTKLGAFTPVSGNLTDPTAFTAQFDQAIGK